MEKLKNTKIGFYSYESSTLSPQFSANLSNANKSPTKSPAFKRSLSLEMHKIEMDKNSSPRMQLDNQINIFINQR